MMRIEEVSRVVRESGERRLPVRDYDERDGYADELWRRLHFFIPLFIGRAGVDGVIMMPLHFWQEIFVHQAVRGVDSLENF